MTEKEVPKAREAGRGEAELMELSKQSRKILRKLGRSVKATWKLYKGSKSGLAGLTIVFGFFFMATFAPFISPYDPEFKAPSEDIFIADSASIDLAIERDWSTPLGLTEAERERQLQRVLVYSPQGEAKVFPVHDENGIVISVPQYKVVPANTSYLNYVHFFTSFFLILEGNTLHEYTYDLVPTADYTEWVLPFTPKYHSNLWNAYSIVLTDGRMAFVLADEHNIWLLDRRPPNPIDNVVRTYTDIITIPETIIGNPIVTDGYFNNGSMIIVPTDEGVVAYDLNITKGAITGYVSNVAIGERRWLAPYEVDGEPFVPVTATQDVITLHYPYDAADEFTKLHVWVATTENRIVAFDRKTGNLTFDKPLVMPSIRDFEITALYPSPRVVLAVGTSGDRGFIAGIDPLNGTISYGNDMYSGFAGHVTSKPQYVPGQKYYLFSTEEDVYLMDELLKVNATFRAPGGGPATPVSFVGNLFVSSIIGGNYFALVTGENDLFLESLQGRNVAPLPPGTYASGNHYILGTDYEGHDILAWLIYGTRAELMVGVTAAFFAVVIGTIVGLVAGFYSGLIDDLLMRTTDVVLSLPGLVILLLFAAVFGPSLLNIIIIIAILSWAGIARVIRSVTISIKERSFVDAAIIAGASESRLIFKHIAPNVLPYAFLYMTFNISGAIVTEAILAFLGFGDVNYVTWGMMLQYLQISGHSLDAPWWLLPPGVAITLLSLSFYLIGRAFDEVVNPRLRKR